MPLLSRLRLGGCCEPGADLPPPGATKTAAYCQPEDHFHSAKPVDRLLIANIKQRADLLAYTVPARWFRTVQTERRAAPRVMAAVSRCRVFRAIGRMDWLAAAWATVQSSVPGLATRRVRSFAEGGKTNQDVEMFGFDFARLT